MKINKILVLSVSALAVCGTLSAQDLRGVVRDADNQPLVGASVYWEGTTIGAGTDAAGRFPAPPGERLRQPGGLAIWAM